MKAKSASVVASQGWLLASALIGMAATLATTVIVAHGASLETLGFFTLIGTLFSLARDLTDLGTSSATCREITQEPEREGQLLGQLLAWRLIPSALLAAGCIALAVGRESALEAGFLSVCAAIVFLSFNNGLFAVFQLRQRQSIPASINISVNLLVIAGAALVLLTGQDPLLFVALILAREAFAIALNRFFALRLLPTRPRVAAAIGQLRHWLSGPLSAYAMAAMAWHLMLNSGVFLVDQLQGGERLGAYGAAFRLATPLFGIGWLLTAPLVPVFALALEQSEGLFRAQVSMTLRLALGTGALLATVGASVSGALIDVIFGDALSAESSAIASETLRWFMLAFAASLVVSVCAPALLAQKLERRLAVFAFMALVGAFAAAIAFAWLGKTSLVAAAIAAGMMGSAIAGVALIGGLALPHALAAFGPAIVAAITLMALPSGTAGLVQIALGTALSLGGIAFFLFQPGMSAYRKQQDTLAREVAQIDITNVSSDAEPQPGGP